MSEDLADMKLGGAEDLVGIKLNRVYRHFKGCPVWAEEKI